MTLKTPKKEKNKIGIGKPNAKVGIHKQSFYHANCSMCDASFTSNDEIGQEVYQTKAELIEALKEYDWTVKGNTVICEECK